MADMECKLCRIAAMRTEIRVSGFVFVTKLWLAGITSLRESQLQQKYLLQKAQTLSH